MLNHRGPLVVYAFTGGLESPVAVARSATIAFQSYDVPTGIHLIAAPDGDVLVQWTTRLSDRPVVQFAPAHALASSPTPFDSDRPLDEPGDWKEVQATDSTYAREDMCGPPASTTGYISPGVLHTARMSGLRPGVAYAYRVGDPDNDGPYSDIAFFIAAPKPDRFARVRVLAMADQGTDEVDGSSQVQGWDHYFHGESVPEVFWDKTTVLPRCVAAATRIVAW